MLLDARTALTAAMKISNSDISDALDLINSISDILQPVPYLGPVLQICNNILQAVQGIGANQEAMKKLSDYATLFVRSLAERSRNNTSFSDSLRINIDAVNDLYDKIKVFVEKEAAKGFMHQALCQAKTANKIQQFYKQISQLAQSLQVAVEFDTNSITRAIENDTKQLVDMMLAIQNNNEAMNAKMNEMLNDAKLQNQKLETLENINNEIRAGLASLPDQIRDVMLKILSTAQERIEKSAGRKLSPRFDWTINPDDVSIDWNIKIGEGSYGTIYRAIHEDHRVAVKVIDKTYVNQEAADAIQKEAGIWYPLHHHNILSLYGVCLNVEKPFLVMPMMKCDLSRHISTHPDLDMQTRIRFITSIANGMAYLHSREFPIIHGDLKANNVLIGFKNEICITDFGLAFIKTASRSNTKNQTGAVRWIAPEKYDKGYKLVTSADVFAFAMTCIEILTGKVPFPEQNEDAIITDWIKVGHRPDRSKNVPDYLWSLIEDCWRQVPSHRPTFRQIVDRLKNPMSIMFHIEPLDPIDEPKPNLPSEPRDSGYTLRGSSGHLEPGNQPNGPPSRAPSPSPSFGPFDNINTSLSLEQLARYKVPMVIRLGIDRGDPEDCKDAIKIISEGKHVSDRCWNVVMSLYIKAAKSGDLESYFELAWLNFTGVGVERSDVDALAYWKRVMEKSNDVVHKTISTYMIGMCYYLGVGANKNLVTGWKMINESKSDEFVLAGQWAFGWECDEPIDKIQSSSRVSKVFFDHVKFGSENDTLMKHLEAVCYFYGFGTEMNQNKAVEMFTSLADCGFAVSQVMLGSCFFDGYGVEKSHETAAEWYKRAAEQGYTWAEWALGECYRDGKGVPQDYAKAVDWYLRAADHGFARAQVALGNCYRDGKGVSEDGIKAAGWYQKAASQGYASAQTSLGTCYRDGLFLSQDYAKAVDWYKKATEQGDELAQFLLACCYRDGKGVPQDLAKAVELYRNGAEAGYPQSCFELAWLYFAGVGVERSDVDALAYWKRVMEKSNDVVHKTISTYMIGMCYYLGVGTKKDLEKGWKMINESWSDEFVLAGQWAFDCGWGQPIITIWSLSHVSEVFFDHVKFGSENDTLMEHLEAVCYFYGFGTEMNQNKAVEMFTSLADCGFAVSQVMLGSCYHDGYVVSENFKKAALWYRKAAEQGYTWAEWALGCCYRDGKGVPQDYAKAVEWFRKAAEQGHVDAQYILGCCYLDGLGVLQNHGKAVEWWIKAASQEYGYARRSLGAYYKNNLFLKKDTKHAEWSKKTDYLGEKLAQCLLACCYRDGKGVPQDLAKAVELYRNGAEAGYPQSCFELAWLYFAGVGVERSDVDALAYWKRVMEKSNDVVHKTISTYMIGMCYYLGVGANKNLVTGWKLINESKNDEFVLAGQWAFGWECDEPIDKIQSSSRVSKVFFDHVKFGSENDTLMKHLEAVCYFYGFGTEMNQNKAVEMFTSLADCGFAVSQVMLGSCFFDGYGVEKSHETAAEWYKRAAEQGYAWGQANLGECYRDGKGVPQDYEKAVEWFQKAAEQGHADAQYNLGICYRDGKGVSEDYVKAVEWFQMASDQGHDLANFVYHDFEGDCPDSTDISINLEDPDATRPTASRRGLFSKNPFSWFKRKSG